MNQQQTASNSLEPTVKALNQLSPQAWVIVSGSKGLPSI